MFGDDYGLGRRREREANWYDTAQICLNGHVITDALNTVPEDSQKFCSECGKPTITVCQNCNEAIRGLHHFSGVIALGVRYRPPNFCHNCGSTFPWTQARLSKAAEVADELDLSDQDKQAIKDNLPDILRDDPAAQASALTLKRLLKKAETAGSVAVGVARALFVDIASETAKKVITGP